jgi:hypothetical protein
VDIKCGSMVKNIKINVFIAKVCITVISLEKKELIVKLNF